MDDGLRKHDPYKELLDDEKQGTRPGFLGGTGESGPQANTDDVKAAKKRAKADAKAAQSAAASDDLRSGEDSVAEGGLYRPGGGQGDSGTGGTLASARQNEQAVKGLYSGKGKVVEGKKNKKGVKGFLKKGGPIVAIILAVFGVGGIMGGTQIFQPFSLVAQFSETFNSMHTASEMRSKTFFRLQMDTGRYKNPIKGTIFSGDTFKITKHQKAELARQGIEYDDNYNGARVLKFNDGDGNVRIVTADAATADRLGEGAVDFATIYRNDPNFMGRYNKGSLTWRGAIANWFGGITNRFLEQNGLSRNAFADFQNKVAQNGGDAELAMKQTLSKGTEEIEGGGFRSKEADEVVRNPEAREGTELVDVDEGNIVPGSSSNEGTYKTGKDLNESFSKTSRSDMSSGTIRSKLDDIGGKIQKGANIACTVGNVVGAVTLMVTAAEAMQIIRLTTGYFEAVDKVKAGDDADAPINELTNTLNEPKTTTNSTLEYVAGAGFSANNDSPQNITSNGIGVLETKDHTVTKTAMQSAGLAALYDDIDSKVNPNDPSVQSFNFTKNINRILGGIGVSMAGFETCAVAKMVANGVTAVTDAISIAACILGVATAAFSFGVTTAVGCGWALAGKIAKSVAFSVAIGVAVAAVISAITPIVTKVLTRDLITNLGGEDLGNALTSGANMYLGNTHRANGGSLSNRDEYTKFALERQQVIADNARYEREMLSPFDLTSKYTFLGTIMTQMMSYLTTSSLMGAITTSSSVVSSSVLAMSPTAAAYNVSESLPTDEEYKATCPYLASIGAVGDAYCNPYSATDISTMGTDPVDIINVLADPNGDGNTSDGNFQNSVDSNGNVKIDGKSDLAKYILYCDNRESAFGIADANIVQEVSSWGSVQSGNNTFNNVTNSAIGAVPVVGDIIDVGSNANALSNIGYVSGESCVAGNNVSSVAVESPDWNKAKYYQRFIEDQSLAESMGLIEKSAVAVFLDEYYEKNPLDNSYEGILARKSGLSKDTVVAILDLVDYVDYLANYDASTRYAFGASVVEVEEEMNFEREDVMGGAVVLAYETIYADVRNRNFAV